MLHKLYKVLLVLFMCAAFTAAAFAQNANSTIQGTVEDTHGAVVPGATIDLTNVGTNQELHATSNGSGFFTFTNLSPANYKVAVNMQGFATWEGNLTLRVSQAAQVNPTLTAAAVSTHVTVRNVTPVINRVNATISDVKNSTTIEAMPVSNRNILSLLAFSPGVVAHNYGGSGKGFTRVNGIPGGSVNYVTDGQTNVNAFSGALNQFPQSTMTLQEVKIQTSNGDAQFGRPGVVEMVTKSGTNHFHGQIFELNQNQHLQARQFHSGPSIPFLQHNEYGFQVGGPAIRNHTFFFFDMEWLKNNQNDATQYFLPPKTLRNGDFSQFIGADSNPITIYDPNTTAAPNGAGVSVRSPFAGNKIDPSRLNPVAMKAVGITPVSGLVPLPEPNIPGAKYWLGEPNYIPTAQKQTQNQRQYTIKVDQLFGASRLAARYYNERSDTLEPEYYAPTAPNNDINDVDNGSLALTSVLSPNTVNVFHVGVQYNRVRSGPVAIPGIAAKLGLPNYPNTVSWMGFDFGYNRVPFNNIDRNNPKSSPNQIVSASDQFSWNRGNHQFMFGFDVNNSRITTSEVGQPGGNYTFSGNYTALQDPAQVALGNLSGFVSDTGSAFADFMLGETDGIYFTNFPVYHTRQTEYAAFAQDNWRVSRKLTLNLGLRYQYWTPFGDSSGLTSTFLPDVAGGMVVYAGKGPLPSQVSQTAYDQFVAAGLPIESAAQAGLPDSLYTMPKNNWEPRLGFAYQLDSKTVLRGGWGIYQWIIPLQQYQQATRKNPPFSFAEQFHPSAPFGGPSTNDAVAELQFPFATTTYGGPQLINQFILGNQQCTNQPAGTCKPPGVFINPTISIGSGFQLVALDPNVKPSTVQEYNLTFGRQLPWSTGLQISYIGNHYYNMHQQDSINYLVPRDNCVAANSPDPAACEAGTPTARRPYPLFATSGSSNYTYHRWNGYGNTNALQVQLTHTVTSNLLFQVYFNWMKALNTVGGSAVAGTVGGAGNLSAAANAIVPAALTPGYSLTEPLTSGAPLSQRLAALYSNDPSLPAKTFKFNANWTLPFGRGQRFLGNAHGILNALVSGYNLAPFFLWHSGLYFGPYETQLASNSLGGLPGGRGIELAPGKTGILPKGQRNADHWFDASIWDPTTGPYAGQAYEYTATPQEGDFRNNIPFNYMTAPGFNEMDLGLYKVTPIWRNLKLDFAAQFFNVYNHASLAQPKVTGIITQAVSQPRTIQLQAKIVF